MRILFIEDDIALQKNLNNHLIAANYVVDLASDGETGLFQGQEYPYDAAIIDVGLPLLDGISVIRLLREKNIDFPILVLTARDSWQDKVAGLDAGADDYMSKPVRVTDVIQILQKHLVNKSAKAA